MLLPSWATWTQPENELGTSQCDFVWEMTQGSVARMIPLSQKRVFAVSKGGMPLLCMAASYAALRAPSPLNDTLSNDSIPHIAAHSTLPDSQLFA